MRERAPGVWQLRASAGFDANGDHRVITRTHRGTKTTAAKTLAELVATTHIPQSTGTVGELLDTWLQVAQISRTTRSVYEGALVHLPARWRQLRVDRVQSSDVARLYSALTTGGVGAQTVRKVHTVLSGAFSQAGRWGQIARNPCQGVKLPAVTSRSDAPTEEQITALLAAASLQERVWLTLAITSGVRRGEVVSLRWPAVDLDGARLTVATSTTVLGEVKSTKTARTDVIAIPDGLVVLLREWRRAQIERALACGVSYDTAGFVLSDDPTCSTGWLPNLATHRFIRLRKRAGVTGVRLHDLRHATATYLLAGGADIVAVSRHMRHSRTSTTLDVYSSLVQGRDRAAADMLGALIERTS